MLELRNWLLIMSIKVEQTHYKILKTCCTVFRCIYVGNLEQRYLMLKLHLTDQQNRSTKSERLNQIYNKVGNSQQISTCQDVVPFVV